MVSWHSFTPVILACYFLWLWSTVTAELCNCCSFIDQLKHKVYLFLQLLMSLQRGCWNQLLPGPESIEGNLEVAAFLATSIDMQTDINENRKLGLKITLHLCSFAESLAHFFLGQHPGSFLWLKRFDLIRTKSKGMDLPSYRVLEDKCHIW